MFKSVEELPDFPEVFSRQSDVGLKCLTHMHAESMAELSASEMSDCICTDPFQEVSRP